MSTVKLTVTGLARYAGREGQISFILHRLTGLGTLLFLAIHIVDTSTVYFFPALYEHAIELYRNPLFMIGEIGLVFSVIYHGVNGARIALFDLVFPNMWSIERQRSSVWWTLGISILIWLPAAFIMARSLLFHSFGIGG